MRNNEKDKTMKPNSREERVEDGIGTEGRAVMTGSEEQDPPSLY